MSLAEFYENAWGKPWEPQGKFTTVNIPGHQWTYTRFSNMMSTAETLHQAGTPPDSIIIRDDYTILHQNLESSVAEDNRRSDRSLFVLTGQPGIGKTTFLLYLLLNRLERRLPTAIQFRKKNFVIIDHHGATLFDGDERNNRLTKECWALCDGNDDVSNPCEAFNLSPSVIIYANPPKVKRWKEWKKQSMAKLLFMDLPSEREIAAIVQSAGYDIPTALAHLDQWGPCTRTILTLLKDPSYEEEYLRDVMRAARDICNHPDLLFGSDGLGKLHNRASAALFISPKPNRSLHYNFFPTMRIAEIINEARLLVPVGNVQTLLNAISEHSPF